MASVPAFHAEDTGSIPVTRSISDPPRPRKPMPTSTHRLPTCLLILAACLVISPDSRAEPTYEDWPNFLGPRHDGTSLETGWLRDWPDEGPEVLWTAEVGEAYSAPVRVDDRLVIFHRDGDQEIIHCLNAETGTPFWEFKYLTTYEDRYGYNNGPRSSPSIDDGRVYTYGAEGILTCLDLKDGSKVWQRPVNKEYNVPQGFFGAGGAPYIEGDLILINLGGPGGNGVAAFNKKTGETVWTTSDDGASYSTPLVREIDGKRMALFFTQAGFLALDPLTGNAYHEMPFRSRTRESVNAATPVVVGNRVFLSATYNVGSVLLDLSGGELTEVWRDREAMQNHWATSLYIDGNLYGMDGRHENGSNFRCIDFETGEVHWSADEGLGRSTYTYADGHLIALGERGHLALIEVSPEKYIEKKRIKLLRYPCWTPPVLSHHRLYLRNERILTCLDLKKTAK